MIFRQIEIYAAVFKRWVLRIFFGSLAHRAPFSFRHTPSRYYYISFEDEDSFFEYRRKYFYLPEDHPTGVHDEEQIHQNLYYEHFLETRICMNISTNDWKQSSNIGRMSISRYNLLSNKELTEFSKEGPVVISKAIAVD